MKITPKKFATAFGLLLLAAVTVLSLLNASSVPDGDIAAPLKLVQQTAKSGNHYTIIQQQAAEVSFVTQRPNKADANTLLSIPAAFTVTPNIKISGTYVLNGKVFNAKAVSHRVGGWFAIHPDGHCSIEGTNMGNKVTPEFLKDYQQPGNYGFQQIKIVSNGKPAGFKAKTLFQRRALVLNKAGKLSVMESREALTLAQFSADIAELGAWNAAYVDMGAWDEGWYRNAAGTPITIGRDLSQTAKQTNWVIFKRPD